MDETAWIATRITTTSIRLTDISGGVLQGPDNFDALDVLPDCNNGEDDFFDVNSNRFADADDFFMCLDFFVQGC